MSTDADKLAKELHDAGEEMKPFHGEQEHRVAMVLHLRIMARLEAIERKLDRLNGGTEN